MTELGSNRLSRAIYRFLGLSHWVCDYDGEVLRFPYYKLAMWPQHPFFTLKWLRQTLLGDNRVLRFHNEDCFQRFATAGRLVEIVGREARPLTGEEKALLSRSEDN